MTDAAAAEYKSARAQSVAKRVTLLKTLQELNSRIPDSKLNLRTEIVDGVVCAADLPWAWDDVVHDMKCDRATAVQVVRAFLDAGHARHLQEPLLQSSFTYPFGQCAEINTPLALALLDAADADPTLQLGFYGMTFEKALTSESFEVVRRTALRRRAHWNRAFTSSTTLLGWAIGTGRHLLVTYLASPEFTSDDVAVLGPRSMIHVLSGNERTVYIHSADASHHPSQGPIVSYTPLQWVHRNLETETDPRRCELLKGMATPLRAAEARARDFACGAQVQIMAGLKSVLPDALHSLVLEFALDIVVPAAHLAVSL